MIFLNEMYMEYICLQFRQYKDGLKMLFIVMYCLLNFMVDFFNDFIKFVEDVYFQYYEIIVVGDFDIDMLYNKRNRFKMIFSDVGFIQIINIVIRVIKNSVMLIDYVQIIYFNCIVEIIVFIYGMSDYYLVCFVYKYCGIKFGKFLYDEIFYCNFKNLNYNEFVVDFDNVLWFFFDMFDGVNEKFDIWEWIFNDVMN